MSKAADASDPPLANGDGSDHLAGDASGGACGSARDAHLHGPPPLAGPQSTEVSADTSEVTSRAPSDLHLESAALPAKASYRHPYEFYAARNGYAPGKSGERSIKRLVSEGRHAVPADLPPLDTPADMPAWWRKHRPGRKVPKAMQAAALAVSSPTGAPGSAEKIPSPAAPPAPRASATATALDFPGQVEALRRMVDDHRHDLELARAVQEPAGLDPTEIAEWAQAKQIRIEAAQQTFKGAFDILRKAENDLNDWRKAHDQTAPRDEVTRVITALVATIYAMAKRLLLTVRPRLVGRPDAEQETIWQTALAEAFRQAKLNKFVAPFVLGDLTPEAATLRQLLAPRYHLHTVEAFGEKLFLELVLAA